MLGIFIFEKVLYKQIYIHFMLVFYVFIRCHMNIYCKDIIQARACEYIDMLLLVYILYKIYTYHVKTILQIYKDLNIYMKIIYLLHIYHVNMHISQHKKREERKDVIFLHLGPLYSRSFILKHKHTELKIYN